MTPKIKSRSSNYINEPDQVVIKLLNDAFKKFENRVKNYSLTSDDELNPALPISIIKLFSQLFKMWSDDPKLQRVLSGPMFFCVYLQLKDFFDDGEDDSEIQSDSSADYSDDECENCLDFESFNVNAVHELMRCSHNATEPFPSNFIESTKKGKHPKVVSNCDEWLSEKNGLAWCNLCNAKFGDVSSLLEHLGGVGHLENYNNLKKNETYMALPDNENECFRCKVCEVEYSNLNSLIKHFFKPQHIQCITNAQEKGTNDEQIKSKKKIIDVQDTKSEVDVSSSKLHFNKKFVVSKGVGKFCQLCEKDMPTTPNVLSHVQGTDHLNKISIFESNQDYAKLSKNGDKFHCLLCGVCFNSVKKLAEHFGKDSHRKLIPSNVVSSVSAVPSVSKTKLDGKSLITSVQLRDSDTQFIIPDCNVVKCILCCVRLNTISEIIAHVNDKSHSQNSHDFTNYREYFTLPSGQVNSFVCIKCSKKFNNFNAILSHCREFHAVEQITQTKPSQKNLSLKERDEKFIKKAGKSNICLLCDKELPNQATILSHCGSMNHVKNANVFSLNENYVKLPQKNCTTFRCSLCDIDVHDLKSLNKHFKEEAHQKTITSVVRKTSINQNSVHIPVYSIVKGDEILKSTGELKNFKSQKTTTPIKSRKPSETNVDSIKNKEKTPTISRKIENPVPANELASSAAKLIAKDSDENVAMIKYDRLFKPFPMIKPDDSFVIAKKDVFYCRLCDVDLTAAIVMAHMNGATHRINIEVLETCRSYVKDVNQPTVECVVCKITHDNLHQLVKHFKDKLHSKLNTATHEEVGEKNNGIFGPSHLPAEQATAVIKNMLETQPKPSKINRCDRKHIFRLNGVVQCNLCGIKWPDMDGLETHISNLNHKRNSKIYQENELFIKQIDSIGDNFECTLCAFSSSLNKVIKHCKKKPHSRAKDADDEKEQSVDDVSSFQKDSASVFIDKFDYHCIVMTNGIARCNLCHSKLPRESTLMSHMNGLGHKHLRQVFEANESFIEHFDEMGFDYRCNLCDTIFTRLDAIVKHCSEETHLQLKNKYVYSEVQKVSKNFNLLQDTKNDDVLFNIMTCDFECALCSITFCGFADLAKHCNNSEQHKILKNAIQPIQKNSLNNVIITSYQYHCNACDIRLYNEAEMLKHQTTKIHSDAEKYFKSKTGKLESSPAIIELVGYEYLCNFCLLPMYSEAELTEHEKSKMHKMSKNFDDVWRFNEPYVQLNNNFDKVACQLCDITFGIERLIQHCTSRNHRMKFVAEQVERYPGDEYVVFQNATLYCQICDCKLINDHNLVNHVNSEGHKSRIAKKKLCA